MAQIIIFENKKLGNVAVCIPTGELPIENVLAKDCPSGAIIVEDSILPIEYDCFFDAWKLDKESIYVDISIAKEITKNRLREERKPLLEALDVEMMKNFGNQEFLTQINAKKQLLRDVTIQVNLIETLDELKLVSLPDVGI